MFYFPPLFPLKGARDHSHSSQGNPQPLPFGDGPDNYRIFIRHWRSENSLLAIQNSLAKCQLPMTIFIQMWSLLKNILLQR